MVAAIAAAGVLIVSVGAEMLHATRVRRVAALAFGPDGQPAFWTRAAPFLRAASLAALTWGMVTLMELTPKTHTGEVLADGEYRHVVIVLDVSPSMRLEDAGPEGDKSRMKRARDVMESFFKRVPMEQFRVSVVAVYNEAKPVVIDTKDIDVVRNILGDLPMHYAFISGETDLFAGLKQAALMARPWQPRSTTLIMVSDGDTVPATGMPKMPASVKDVLVVGVGDTMKGTFIAGRQSRQDTATLRQIAVRLGGTYHNGNENHLSTATLQMLTEQAEASPFEKLTRREYALCACLCGSLIYALLPALLHLAGTAWTPGTQVVERRIGQCAEVERNEESVV